MILRVLAWLLGFSDKDLARMIHDQLDLIEKRQVETEVRLKRLEDRDDMVVKGIKMMHDARVAGVHAAAATPRLLGETASEYARRVLPHAEWPEDAKPPAPPKAANVVTDDPDEEMPESHV